MPIAEIERGITHREFDHSDCSHDRADAYAFIRFMLPGRIAKASLLEASGMMQADQFPLVIKYWTPRTTRVGWCAVLHQPLVVFEEMVVVQR